MCFSVTILRHLFGEIHLSVIIFQLQKIPAKNLRKCVGITDI